MSVARLAITRYSVGAMHSTSTCSRAMMLQALVRVEARVVQERGGAARATGAMNALRADLIQPAAAVHHTRSPGVGREPVLGLQVLAGQVALAVQDGLRLAARAAR